MQISETSKIRYNVVKFLKPETIGLDLGFGGDSIVPWAINIDLNKKYTNVGNNIQHIYGDARKLNWFNDNTIDFIYSSHLLEDFENTEEILIEWIRVIKPGGYLILYLPNEKRYRDHCNKIGERSNEHHKILDMSSDYINKILRNINKSKTINIIEHGYSFLIVDMKT